MSAIHANGQHPSAYEAVKRRVQDRVRDGHIDPLGDADTVHQQIDEVVRAYQREAHLSDEQPALAEPTEMTRRVMAAICDYGPLSSLLARTDIEEIMIHGDQLSYIAADGDVYFPTAAATLEEYRAHVDRLLATVGRQVSYSHPIDSVGLPGGVRLAVVIWPLAKDGLIVNIRKPVANQPSLAQLVTQGVLSMEAAGLLWTAMQQTSRVLIAGRHGAGKTTLANAALAAIPPKRRVRIVEERTELSAALSLGAYIETGQGGLRDCLRAMMWFDPQWLVIGEIIGAEAVELFRAFNAGCGFLTTLHCNRASAAIPMLTRQVAINADLGGGAEAAREDFAENIDFVVFLDKDGDEDHGVRREVVEIAWVQPELRDGRVVHEPIFVREELGAPLQWAGSRPDEECSRRLERGLPPGVSSLTALLDGRATVEAVRGQP